MEGSCQEYRREKRDTRVEERTSKSAIDVTPDTVGKTSTTRRLYLPNLLQILAATDLLSIRCHFPIICHWYKRLNWVLFTDKRIALFTLIPHDNECLHYNLQKK